MPRPSSPETAATSSDAFRAELQCLRADRAPREDDSAGAPGPLDLGPASVHEAVTRQMVESLAGDIREIKGRLNTLFFMLIGGIMLEIAIRIISP
jgi:hypothetical protein